MTRINSAIRPICLPDEMLLAEHREIKRLPKVLEHSIRSGSIEKIPERFTLGRGHLIFFLDKMWFIRRRYIWIYNECLRRKFNVKNYLENFQKVSSVYENDYTPTEEEYHLLVERISQRIIESKKKSWHYAGRPAAKEEILNMLNDDSKCFVSKEG